MRVAPASAPRNSPRARGSQRVQWQQDMVPSTPSVAWHKLPGSQELLPHTASGFSFDFDVRDPSAPTGRARCPMARQASSLSADASSLYSP